MTALLIVAALAGCAAKPPKTALREGARMVDLYRGTATEEAVAGESRRKAVMGDEGRCRWWVFAWRCGVSEAGHRQAVEVGPSYTRTAANELELLFPRLPNPDIYIHVLPHLATEARVPVPGYTTAVPLYERVEYALPEEVNELPAVVDPGTDAADATVQEVVPTVGGEGAEEGASR